MLRRTIPSRFATPLSAVGGASGLTTTNFDLTHAVTNQSVPLADYDAFASCPRFAEAFKQYGVSAEHTAGAQAYGKLCGSSEMLEASHTANKVQPTFAAFDKFGHRSPGRAEFHPAYHQLMSAAIEHRVPSLPWTVAPDDKSSSPFVARGALSMMHYGLEQGTSCPLTMTCAGVAPLKRALEQLEPPHQPHAAQAAELKLWIDKLTSNEYDSRDIHVSLKRGATIGMSMTEKQGGSDVRANSTIAVPVNSHSDFFRLRGHKWFTSAPMCDAFLTLAQVEGSGLTCFLVPRWIAPGEYNKGLQFQRLKEKMGDKSNASSEVEYHDALGFRVGPAGSGVKTIIEMVNLTRLDCLIGSAALMHRACTEAAHHATKRSAFGGLLCEKPMMQNVLCDLALESEAANALGLRMCRAFDLQQYEGAFARIGVAIAKYYVCKRAPALAYEAMECLGGNGYTEDFPMARIFRQSPLNAIWEGSGNVIVLDVFRAMMKEPQTVGALRGELSEKLGDDPRLQAALKEMDAAFKGGKDMEIHGRRIVERTARLLQAAALKDHGPQMVYDAFVESRVVQGGAHSNGSFSLFGTLDKKFVSKEMMERVAPVFV